MARRVALSAAGKRRDRAGGDPPAGPSPVRRPGCGIGRGASGPGARRHGRSRSVEECAPAPQPPTLRGSAQFVPVAKTELYAGTAITLVGIELYADGFLVDFRVAPVDGGLREPRLVITCHNDRGRRYRAWRHGSSGNAGGSHRWLLSYSFAPALHPGARELRVEVMKLRSPDGERRQFGPWLFTVPL